MNQNLTPVTGLKNTEEGNFLCIRVDAKTSQGIDFFFYYRAPVDGDSVKPMLDKVLGSIEAKLSVAIDPITDKHAVINGPGYIFLNIYSDANNIDKVCNILAEHNETLTITHLYMGAVMFAYQDGVQSCWHKPSLFMFPTMEDEEKAAVKRYVKGAGELKISDYTKVTHVIKP